MIRIILPLAVLLVAYLVYRRIRAMPPAKRRSAWLMTGLVALVIVVAVATLTGRMHWLGAAITGALLFVVRLFPLLARLFPVLQWLHRRRGGAGEGGAGGGGGHAGQSHTGGDMNRAEALAILGLKEGASKEEIVAAHRHLMQKLHPDRDGNDYLAAKLNQAKDLLVG